MSRRRAIAIAMSPLVLWACSETRATSSTAPQAPGSASASASGDVPAASASAAAAAAAPDAGYDGPLIGATIMQAPIFSDMEYPSDKRENKVIRLGYLRYGEKTPVIPEPHRKANCSEGWYELLAGGFVCGKYATLDLDHPKIRLVKAADLSGPLPYVYGVNVMNGTPLYRQVPSHEERLKLEPWLVRPKKAKTAPEDDNPYAPASALAGSLLPDAGAAATSDDSDKPWWQKDAPDGGPPSVTLEDLQEDDGPIARRMVKGFFLSLDHDFPAAGAKWWKTEAGLVAPYDRIFISKPVTDYHGVWLGTDNGTFATKDVASRRIDKLPVAFILNGRAHKWTLDDSHKHATQADGELDRFQAVGLTGETASAGGTTLWETDEGWWLKAVDATRTDPGPPPEGLGEHEKWIDVNQKRETLVAFEGTTPVFATIVSSGRNEHETPVGSFRIREKHIAATMDGDADTAADGPYSIEDVPYIEYFNGGYALHGAFWHAEFGHVKSHGCVNLAPWDAKNLFGWTDPQLPEGWHAVVATKDHPGTRVVVHDRGPGTCQGPKMDVCEKP
jgi:hypothetical protein